MGFGPARSAGRDFIGASLTSRGMGDPRLGAARGPPGCKGGARGRGAANAVFRLGAGDPGPALARSLKQGSGGSGGRQHTSSGGSGSRSTLAASGSIPGGLRLKACPSQAGEATRPCAVPTELPPPSPGPEKELTEQRSLQKLLSSAEVSSLHLSYEEIHSPGTPRWIQARCPPTLLPVCT